MRRQLTVAVAALVLAAAPVFAVNGNIGLYFDSGAALCQQDVPCGGSTDIWVYGLLQGASQTGITGAEYGVLASGDVSGWFFIETPAAPLVIGGAFPGNPAGGISLAWPGCQVGDGVKVLLETVHVINQTDCSGDEIVLTVTKKFNSSNEFFQCPEFFLCDELFTQVCLGSNQYTCQNPNPPYPFNSTCSTSGECFLNPAPGRNCQVAVKETSWSTVKGLYAK